MIFLGDFFQSLTQLQSILSSFSYFFAIKIRDTCSLYCHEQSQQPIWVYRLYMYYIHILATCYAKLNLKIKQIIYDDV